MVVIHKRKIIRKLDMTEKQSIECTVVENFLKKILIEKYKRKTSANQIYKSNNIIRIYMRCMGRDCNFTFKTAINIKTKECEITYNESNYNNICKHNPFAENQSNSF